MPLSDKIVRDAFTEKLLEIMIALVEKRALRFKKEYAELIEIRLTTLYQIERQDRNYPLDGNKRSLAILALREKYFVNPAFLGGTSDTMFFKEPLKVVKETGSGKITKISKALRNADKNDETEGYKLRIAELESSLAKCRAELKKAKAIRK